MQSQKISFLSGTLPGQHSPSPAKYNVNSVRMFLQTEQGTPIEMISLYSGSHSGGGDPADIATQGIFPESAQSIVFNQTRKDVDFKVFGGGTNAPSFLAIGVDGPRKKMVLMSGSDSNPMIRESYDDNSVSLIVSGVVAGFGKEELEETLTLLGTQ